MRWLNNLFKASPATIDEGVAWFDDCPWTEEELVAWLNRQDAALQADVWHAIACDQAAGHSRETILRSLSRLRKKVEASTPGLFWRMLDLYWECRTGWWLGGLMNGTNKPIRVKVD